MLEYVLDALHVCALYDTGGLLDAERYSHHPDLTWNPLQLEFLLHALQPTPPLACHPMHCCLKLPWGTCKEEC